MSSQKALLTGQAKGHHLWNAAKVVSDYLEKEGHSLVKDRNILELGAGGALPSIVSAIHGAAAVVITDYPDTDLIDNIRQNVSSCPLIREKCRVHVEVTFVAFS